MIRADGDGLASPGWLLLRTALLGFLIPAVVWDRDRRGLHDKAAGTVVVVDPNKAHATKKPAAKRPSVARTSVKTGAVSTSKSPGPARQPKKAELNACSQEEALAQRPRADYFFRPPHGLISFSDAARAYLIFPAARAHLIFPPRGMRVGTGPFGIGRLMAPIAASRR